MALIHVARGGTNIGTFSIEEIREGLGEGRFFPNDLAWEQGMPNWRPLSEVMARKEAGGTPVTAAAEASTLPVTAAISSGADTSLLGRGLPWDHRAQLGLIKAFFETVALLLTKPTQAFGMMKTEGGLIEPMLFALIGGCSGMLVGILFQFALYSLGFMVNRDFFEMGLGMGMGIVLVIIVMPIVLACWLFIWSGLVHVCLMLAGGAKKPFETTFRVICFSSGSTYLLAIVPVCGRLVALIYTVVLQCIGLGRAHETDTGKAVMAVLLPIVICCGSWFILFVLGFGALSLFPKH